MIDFGKALQLMDVIVKAGQHGPAFTTLVSEAQTELKQMLEAHKTEELKVPSADHYPDPRKPVQVAATTSTNDLKVPSAEPRTSRRV